MLKMLKIQYTIFIFEEVTSLFDEALRTEKYIVKTEMLHMWKKVGPSIPFRQNKISGDKKLKN